MLYSVLLTMAVSFPPPALTIEQQRDLATARDDADHREQAFSALVEHVRTWNASLAADGAAIRIEPDLAAMRARPAAFRGELCRVEGELLQQTTLAPPYEDVSEWFIRETRSGDPVMAYILHAEGAAAFTDRSIVRIDGLFYKRLRFTARDGHARGYPAFVGRFPTLIASSSAPPTSLPGTSTMRGLDLLSIIAGPVAVLTIVFVGLRMWIARKGRLVPPAQQALSERWPRHEATNTDAATDDAIALPEDPAAALAELRRRAASEEP